MKLKNYLLAALALACISCKTQTKDEPYFNLRGIVLAWEDVDTDTTVINWLGKMKETGLNTISIFGGPGYESPEYAAMKQKCVDLGLDFEYEEHGMTWMLPRDLFAEHPEYFRMNEEGERVPDYNGCPSNPEALKVVYENTKRLAEIYHPTNHRYYFWLHDGGGKCHCPECEKYNLADQGLIFENTVIKALREIDPEAMLAHLAYDKTTPAPTCIKPEEGIFLEYAPIDRCHDKPLSDSLARWDARPKWCNGEYLQMLKDNLEVFGAENAQVLEYWLDVSLASMWTKPQSKLNFSKEVFEEDLRTYADLGICNITCYGAWADEYYAKTFEDVSFIDDYGNGLFNFRKQ